MKIVVLNVSALSLFLAIPGAGMAAEIETQANVPVEITLQASRPHADPFNDVSLDLVFTEAIRN